MRFVPLLFFLLSILSLTHSAFPKFPNPFRKYIEFFEVIVKPKPPCDAGDSSCTTTFVFHYKNVRRWNSPKLITRYTKEFGPWDCHFMINQDVRDRAAHFTWCRTADGKVSVDGVWSGPRYTHFAYYDKEKGKQHFMVAEYHDKAAVEDRRSLATEHLPDVVPNAVPEEEDEQLGWVNEEEQEFSDKPVIEVGFFVDKHFMDYIAENDADEGERFAHFLINGVHAMMRSSGFSVKISFFRILTKEEDDRIAGDFANVTDTVSEVIRQLMTGDHIDAKDGRMVGRPDILLIVTERWKKDQAAYGAHNAGKAALNAACTPSGHAWVTLRRSDPEDGVKTLWFGPKPYIYLQSLFAETIAHQFGHLMGLHDSVDTDCPCATDTGMCIMASEPGYPSFKFGDCYENQLRDYAANQLRTHGCMFRRDVFKENSDTSMPKVVYANLKVGQHGKFEGNKGSILIEMRLYKDVKINLRAAIDFKPADEKRGCRLYHSLQGQPFAVFENCKWAQRRWKGFFHMDDKRVLIDPVMENGTWFHKATFSRLLDANDTVPKVTNPLPSIVNLSLIIGIDEKFSNSSGGHEAAINRAVHAVTMADTVFRQMRIRVQISRLVLFDKPSNLSLIEHAKQYYKSVNLSETAFLIFTSAADQSSTHEPALSCTFENVGIVNDLKDAYKLGAETAHVLGHLLGLTDDGGKCGCRTKLGTCLMHPQAGTRALI